MIHLAKALARFASHRDLAGFAFAEASVDETLVRKLPSGQFTEEAHNAVFIGEPSSGKSHLTTTISVEAIEKHGKRVRFFSTVELVNALEQEKANGKSGQIAFKLMYVDLVILDEPGDLPFSQAGGMAASFALKALRAHQCNHHHQFGICRRGASFWGRQNDNGIAGPIDEPLPYRGDRQPELAL